MRQKAFRLLSAAAVLVAAAWLLLDPGFEALIAAISGLAALILSVGTATSQVARLEPQSRPALANSLAVLPLRSLGDDPEGEFFAEGMTEDIIAHLARLRDLRVISRTSSLRFRDSELTAVEIAARLGVRNILEGSVRRQAGSLRVSTHLIDARTDEHLWAEIFDRPWSDIFAVQSEIAKSVAAALHVNLSQGERAALGQAPTHDLEAYRCMLEGRRRYDRGFEIPESVAFYEEAIRRDPEYADAYAGLAQASSYTGQGYWGVRPRDVLPRAIEAAERALELSPRNAEAMATLGYIEYVHNLNVEKGCALMRDSIALGQSSSVPFANYGAAMYIMERHEEALSSFNRAIEYDPLSSVVHLNHAVALHLSGRNEEVLEKVRRSGEVFGIGLFGFVKGLALVELGRAGDALAGFRETADAFRDWGFALQMLAYGLVCARQVDEGQDLLLELEAREPEEYLLPLGFAFAHCAAGDDGEAIQRLEQSFADRAGLPWINAPAFRRLRPDERYQNILARMGVNG